MFFCVNQRRKIIIRKNKILMLTYIYTSSLPGRCMAYKWHFHNKICIRELRDDIVLTTCLASLMNKTRNKASLQTSPSPQENNDNFSSYYGPDSGLYMDSFTHLSLCSSYYHSYFVDEHKKFDEIIMFPQSTISPYSASLPMWATDLWMSFWESSFV